MKLLILFLLIATSALAADKCVPDDNEMKVCKQFVQEVLKPSVFEDISASENEPSSRFIKDEKKAVKLLSSYDPSKLTFANQKCYFNNARKSCVKLEDVKGPLGCESAFDVLQFFRGLLKGMKLNGWSSDTINLGKGVIQKHIDYVFSSEPSLLETLIVFEILTEAQTQGHLTTQYKSAKVFSMEGGKISQELMKLKKSFKEPMSCEQMNTIHQKEVDETAALIRKWKSE